MLFIFDKKADKLSISDETDFKTHAIMERRHMEEWVLDHPQLVGEDLLIITNEYDKFDKTKERLDILCIDKNGKLIVVELKRDDSGKDVELQAIKYAAYCSTLTFDDVVTLRREFLHSHDHVEKDHEETGKELLAFINNDDFEELDDKPRIIVAAKEFRPEVTASVIWLNKCGLDITCVKLTPYKIQADLIGLVSSIIIPVPEAKEYIVKADRKEASEKTQTRSQMEYSEFYKDISQSLEKIIHIAPYESGGRSYCKIPASMSHVHFEWGFHGRPRNRFGVELHFEKVNKEANSTLLDEMKKFQSEIEKETGEKVTFEKDWGPTWAKLYIEKVEGEKTAELKKWAVEKMAILYKLLNPKLEKMQ
jgi:hypothetical protein